MKIVFCVTLVILFAGFSIQDIHAQRMRDGIPWGSESDLFEFRTSAGFNFVSDAGSRYGIMQIPVTIRFVFHPEDAVKPEGVIAFSSFFGERDEGRNIGIGAFSAAGVRYDAEMAPGLFSAVRIGVYWAGARLRGGDVTDSRPAFYAAWAQEYELTHDLNALISEGVGYRPGRQTWYPTLLLGIRFARVVSFGVDVASFWMSREDLFLRPATAF